MIFPKVHGWVLLLCVGSGWLRASPMVDAANEVPPTVTVATGDTGGKFFGAVPDPAKTRRYYVAAESDLWDYAPSGRDEICGGTLPPAILRNRKAGKIRYVQYTDATFTARVIPNRSLGIMGPVLRGVVGDYLVVTFLNKTSQPLSMHPHGVKYDKDSEGAYMLPAPGRGAAVGSGARFTYVWHLDEESGPMPEEPSSKGWLYHSHVTGDAETNLGLMGGIIVTDPKRARPDGTPQDVDRELATLFMIFDESELDSAAREAAEYGLPVSGLTVDWAEMQRQIEEGSRASINGYIFGNLPGLQVNEGERTRWYLFALGSERDFHTPHWHGLRVIEEGRRRTDVVELLPASMKVADLVADNPGTWLFHCHVAEHMREGMFAPLVVHARGTVGVNRSPAHAFLGYASGMNSLRIDRAETIAAGAGKPGAGDLVVEGVVTVFDGFAIFNEAIRIRIADRTLEFQPDEKGVALAGGARFRVKNANEFGVVRGGLMEFELVVPAGAGLGAVEMPLALSMDVARGHHVATRAAGQGQ